MSSLDDYIVHVGLDVAVQLVGEAKLYRTLISGSCIFQPEGHSFVGACTERGDKCGFDLVFFLEGDLVIARLAIKEGE